MNSANNSLDIISSAGTAVPSDINSGATALVKGDLITGTRTLAGETPGTATAANISKDKTAWVNGNLITGSGEDNAAYANTVKKLQTIDVSMSFVTSKGSWCSSTVGQIKINYDANGNAVSAVLTRNAYLGNGNGTIDYGPYDRGNINVAGYNIY